MEKESVIDKALRNLEGEDMKVSELMKLLDVTVAAYLSEYDIKHENKELVLDTQ